MFHGRGEAGLRVATQLLDLGPAEETEERHVWFARGPRDGLVHCVVYGRERFAIVAFSWNVIPPADFSLSSIGPLLVGPGSYRRQGLLVVKRCGDSRGWSTAETHGVQGAADGKGNITIVRRMKFVSSARGVSRMVARRKCWGRTVAVAWMK